MLLFTCMQHIPYFFLKCKPSGVLIRFINWLKAIAELIYCSILQLVANA